MNTKFVVFLVVALIAVAAVDLWAKPVGTAVTETGRTQIGPEGRDPTEIPVSGQNVTLPSSTGSVVITTDLNDAVAEFGTLNSRWRRCWRSSRPAEWIYWQIDDR